MKIEQNNDTTFSIISIDFNELELIKSSLDAVHTLLISTILDNLIDNQEKRKVRKIQSTIIRFVPVYQNRKLKESHHCQKRHLPVQKIFPGRWFLREILSWKECLHIMF